MPVPLACLVVLERGELDEDQGAPWIESPSSRNRGGASVGLRRPALWSLVGMTLLSAAGNGAETISLPGGEQIPRDQVDFERHVTSLFSRHGCNSAACHGSFQGRGGLRMSLFGYSAEMDHAAVAALGTGRIDLEQPTDSLLLLKPTGQEDHEGGVRFKPASWQHELLTAWIENGALWREGSGQVDRIEVSPAEITFGGDRVPQPLSVTVSFADGTQQAVRSLCSFTVKDDSVASVDAAGVVRPVGNGDTSVIVSYRRQIIAVPVLVPQVRTPDLESDPANLIDVEVTNKLVRLGIAPSARCTDATFLRRASLDATGTLPVPAEVRAFLNDRRPDKRLRKIEQLLHRPQRAALWATRMCDITGCDVTKMEAPEKLRGRRAKMWHDWFGRRFEENLPYDQLARGVLCATSRGDLSLEAWIDDEVELLRQAEVGFAARYADRPDLDLYWRRAEENGSFSLEEMAERTAAAFLGIRINCARCHQHPFDRWSRNDYVGFGNIFSRVQFGASTPLRARTLDLLEAARQAGQDGLPPARLPRLREVFVSDYSRQLKDPESSEPVLPRPLGGERLDPSGDPREAFFQWLVREDNPYFAANMVNRIWAKYFGSGLVEPVDGFSLANPPSHPRLLDRLSREFISSGYDIRHIERLILQSNTYQRSAVPSESNRHDSRNFSHALVRPLLAEVAIDAVNDALECRGSFGEDVPPGSRAIEVAPNRLADVKANGLFATFGRGERTSICDCDRADGTSLQQTLYLMSDEALLQKICAGRLQHLLASRATDQEIIEEFYLATLSRMPTPRELTVARQHIADSDERQAALVDLVWSWVNVREFLTNH